MGVVLVHEPNWIDFPFFRVDKERIKHFGNEAFTVLEEFKGGLLVWLRRLEREWAGCSYPQLAAAQQSLAQYQMNHHRPAVEDSLGTFGARHDGFVPPARVFH